MSAAGPPQGARTRGGERRGPLAGGPTTPASTPAQVSVSIVEAVVDASTPSWRLTYEVRNSTGSPVWLVDDGALALRHVGRQIELSYAREAMQPGAKVFGYFAPAVVAIAGHDALRRSVMLRWPCRLSDLWNPQREAALSPGDYAVTVRVGFGTTDAPAPPRVGQEVEEPVLAWQTTAVSKPMTITLPPYPAASGEASPLPR